MSNDLKINGVNIGSIDAGEGLQAKVDAINAVSDETGVTGTVAAKDSFTTKTADMFTELTFTEFNFSVGDDISINGVDVTFSGTTAAIGAADINANSSLTGVTAFVDGAGDIHLFSEGQITLGDGSGGGAVGDFGDVTDLEGTLGSPAAAAT